MRKGLLLPLAAVLAGCAGSASPSPSPSPTPVYGVIDIPAPDPSTANGCTLYVFIDTTTKPPTERRVRVCPSPTK